MYNTNTTQTMLTLVPVLQSGSNVTADLIEHMHMQVPES